MICRDCINNRIINKTFQSNPERFENIVPIILRENGSYNVFPPASLKLRRFSISWIREFLFQIREGAVWCRRQQTTIYRHRHRHWWRPHRRSRQPYVSCKTLAESPWTPKRFYIPSSFPTLVDWAILCGSPNLKSAFQIDVGKLQLNLPSSRPIKGGGTDAFFGVCCVQVWALKTADVYYLQAEND